MKLYLAGNHEVKNGKRAVTWKGINILESYYYAKDNKYFPDLLSTCESFLLDSGAFTFMNGIKSQTVDWDAYTEGYGNFIKHYGIDLFIEMDIDSIVGIKEVERLRRKLEDITHKKPIPVWHVSRGKEYFIKMCEEYPYVAIGGIVTKEIPQNKYDMIFPWLIKEAHKKGCKIHGLGFTQIKLLKKYKFDSVDSKALVSGNMGGYIYKFFPSGEMKQIKQDNSRLKHLEGALNNFSEWVKFSKYANLHL